MATMSESQSSTDALLKELIEFCNSESLSEDGLREIIERYGCKPISNNLNNNRYGFLIVACHNELVTEGIIRCLLEYFPDAAAMELDSGITPLHCLLDDGNAKNATRGMVQLLIDAHPESLRRANSIGYMPLHHLCTAENVDASIAVDILGLLLERYPEATRYANNRGYFPIHAAIIKSKSFEFCRMLIQAYPGSERIAASGEILPIPPLLHLACEYSTVATADYLYNVYPECINLADEEGRYPIHYAIDGLNDRTNPTTAIEMVQFLLGHNPNAASQKFDGIFPLCVVCAHSDSFNGEGAIATSKMNAALKIAQALYDAYPEAIEDNNLSSLITMIPEKIETFIMRQFTYARQARNTQQMNTPDVNGQLPLHRALFRGNVTLGSIKLLVKGNPLAIRTSDNLGGLPLHVACYHHESTEVVDYLIGLDPSTLTAVDRLGNTPLHVACLGASYHIIALLLEKYGALSVSKRNVHNKLPIDLIFKSISVSDREGVDYIGSIFQLIRAYPESLMGSVVNMRQEQQS